MKFWQLVSITREDAQSMENVLQLEPWKKFQDSYSNFDQLVDAQNRTLLDQIVPKELVVAVLSQSNESLFLGDGLLRSRPLNEDDTSISLLQAYLKFGALAVEQALENGLVKVSSE